MALTNGGDSVAALQYQAQNISPPAKFADIQMATIAVAARALAKIFDQARDASDIYKVFLYHNKSEELMRVHEARDHWDN